MFALPTTIRLRVALADIEPPIWRRLLVPRTFTLGEVHQVIQAAFGWWDSHLHAFHIGGLMYGDLEQIGTPEFEGERRGFDEQAVTLADFDHTRPIAFVYEYDFGDGWDHLVEFEDQLVDTPAPRVARCIDGARARPPEDVGGASGYERFLEILADPRHPEHRETRRWAGGHFDPEWFDRERCDREVHAALRPNRRIRLHQPAPSRRRRPRS
jgi:hypothetical protein